MAESGIDKIGVNLVDATFEANVIPYQVSIWSLGCDIEINDVDATIQEVKVNDIILSGNIATDSLEVDITTTKTNVMDIDVNVALGGIHSSIVESQVVSYDKIKDITEISPEAVNEPRYAASALSVKCTYDSIANLDTKIKVLEAKVENGNSGGGGSGGGSGSIGSASDVKIENLTGGDILVYDKDSTFWKNRPMTYFHPQNNAAEVWIITHNLGKYPNVKVLDSQKIQVFGDVQYIDENRVKVTFGGAFSGTAYLD
jgi:hypothetical protein